MAKTLGTRDTKKMEGVKFLKFPSFGEPNGSLHVYESGAALPMQIVRVFLVSAHRGSKRGQHAHRRCAQVLVCVSGKVRVTCRDGETSESFTLDSPETGLLVPPGIWAEQDYEGAASSLMVLCDRPFEESDYIRDYNEYLSYREQA